MKSRILMLLAVAAVSIFTACSTTGGANQNGERIVVELATITLIDRADNPAEKAAKVVEAVDAAQTLLLDQNTTVGALRDALTKRVAERNLSPGENLIALEAIQTISAEVEKRVGAGLLSPQAIVSINTVLGWVKNTAALYVSKPA